MMGQAGSSQVTYVLSSVRISFQLFYKASGSIIGTRTAGVLLWGKKGYSYTQGRRKTLTEMLPSRHIHLAWQVSG